MSGTALWLGTRVADRLRRRDLVLVLFDDTRRGGWLLALGFAVLTGLAYAVPMAAWTSTRESDASFPP